MRRKLFLMVLSLMAVLLPGCSAKEDEGSGAVVVEDIAGDGLGIEGRGDGETSGDMLPGQAEGGYQKVYSRIVSEKEEDACTFALIYLDQDDVPELVLYDTVYGTYSIYTVKDGDAFCMMDAMATVEMSYFEKTGIVAQFARWDGGGDEGGYGWSYYQVSRDRTLADGDVPVCHYRYDAVNDAEGNWTGEGITKYYRMDGEDSTKEIDEAAYREIAGELGIVEGKEVSCGEHALGREDMLNLLSGKELPGLGGLEGQAGEGTADGQRGDETAGGGVSEEELMADLNRRTEYYRKSAYYEEITDYWENVREVRDISNRMEPLYESDRMYLTREMVADDPLVVIYLAKNEIYARHGYIFEGPDLYNYFMGCTWYTPTVRPADFDDGVFNEYEKANLKLLNELAGDFQAKRAYQSVLENLYQTYTLPDGTRLGYDEITDLSFNKFAVCDIDRDGKEELVILWVTAYTAGMSEIVYGFDYEAGAVRTELLEYPSQTFYDNGVVKVGLSHNQGLAGEIEGFWPYTFYRYDKNADKYVVAAEVDAWNKAYYETDYFDKPFPDELDVDGDGILYRVMVGDEDKLIDLREYQKWQELIIGGAKEVEIPFVELTEGNIKAVSGKG